MYNTLLVSKSKHNVRLSSDTAVCGCVVVSKSKRNVKLLSCTAE